MNIIAIMGPMGVFYKDEPIDELSKALSRSGFQLIYPKDSEDLLKLIENNARISGVIFDWDKYSMELCSQINELNEYLPLYAFINTHSTLNVSMNEIQMALFFFEYSLNSADEIAQRIQRYTAEYIDAIIPPFTKALFTYAKEGNYTFCTPGHMAGTAFEKSPVGCLFHDFFGANVLKVDVSISVTELGSLLDHSGPHREAETFIAQTFNADRSYMVTNGTSTANKIVGMYSAPAGSTILIDRNCHKSLAHLMMISDVVPLYLRPARNAYGILGCIPQQEFSHVSISQKIEQTTNATWPVHAVITHSTYDGLLYNTNFIKQTLDVKSIHFDSAWVPYTNFHEIYEGKSGMGGRAIPGKVIYETQSTHKLLAAFSQASMIHIKGEYNENIFNEAYMMHTTTSPNYGIVASIEIAAAMMRGNTGWRMINRSIERALHFRNEMTRLRDEFDGWFYHIWQPDGNVEAECWPLNSGDNWHGFANVDTDHMYLDPIKVTILMPGMNRDGTLNDWGIPAVLVAKYLDEQGIVVEKTGPYNLLFLFSIGIDKTRSLSLLRELTDFKRAYDLNMRVRDILPELYAQAPDFYKQMRIQELAQGIHNLMKLYGLPKLMLKAFDVLPEMVLTPYQMFQQQLKGNIEKCELQALVGRVNANMVLPYPPGVPLIMPGERVTEESRVVLDFLLMLCELGKRYPGFETNIHGLEQTEDGHYLVTVLSDTIE